MRHCRKWSFLIWSMLVTFCLVGLAPAAGQERWLSWTAVSRLLGRSAAKAGPTVVRRKVGEAGRLMGSLVVQGARAEADEAARLIGRSANWAARGEADDAARWLHTLGCRQIDEVARLTGRTTRGVAPVMADDLARVAAALTRAGLAVPAAKVPEVTKAVVRLEQILGKACALEALRLGSRHGAVAVDICGRLGQRGVYYLERHGPRLESWYRAAQAAGRPIEFLETLARYGDRFISHLEQHKKLYAGGVALAAFLADPQPVLRGVGFITEQVAEKAVVPITRTMIETGGTVTSDLVTRLIETLGGRILFLLLILLGLPWYLPRLVRSLLAAALAWRTARSAGEPAEPAGPAGGDCPPPGQVRSDSTEESVQPEEGR